MSNYILIGASGGIGSQLTEYLQGKGHSILLAQHKSPINKEALVQTLTHISSVEATDFESVHNLFSYGIKKLGNINLLELLENFKSEEPIALGRLINYSPDRSLLYHSGGAGMVFNRAAFEKICEFFLIKENYYCLKIMGERSKSFL